MHSPALRLSAGSISRCSMKSSRVAPGSSFEPYTALAAPRSSGVSSIAVSPERTPDHGSSASSRAHRCACRRCGTSR